MKNLQEAGSDRYGAIQTGIGTVFLAFGARGIRMIMPGATGAADFERKYRRRFGRLLQPGPVPRRYAHAVRAAARGRPFEMPEVDLSDLHPFESRVLGALSTIPRGQVRTYGWLARQAGRPGAARAAGNVMARNPVPLLLPCHRVVPARGGLGGYAFGPAIKRALLRKEGLNVGEP